MRIDVALVVVCAFMTFKTTKYINVLTDICHDVNVEPRLQTLSGETFTTHSTATQDNSRLDIIASGFWGGRFERKFFNVKVINPFAPKPDTTDDLLLPTP